MNFIRLVAKLAVETKVKTSKIVVKLDVLWVVSIKIKASITFVVDKIYALANPATSLRKSGGCYSTPSSPGSYAYALDLVSPLIYMTVVSIILAIMERVVEPSVC